MRRIGLLLLSLAFFAVAAGADERKEKKDTAIEPTHRGRVMGRIYDAVSGAPLEGAIVCVRQEGAFATTGRTVGKTDATGRYQCEAVIGRVSENFDIGRALSSGLVGILLGGASNETKRVDITRLDLRVEREGYKPFEGVVMCRSVDPDRFSVSMQPILLAQAGSPVVSTTADGWGVARIAGVAVEPPVLKPGAEATVRVTIASPPVVRLRDVRVECLYRLDDKWQTKGLKAQEQTPDGTLLFTTKFRVPKSSRGQADELVAGLLRCPYDIAAGGDRRSALLQVAPDEAGEKAAAERAVIFQLLQAGENVSAANRLKALTAQPEVTAWDLRTLAKVSRRLHDNATVVSALKRLVEMTPQKPELPRLVMNGEYAAALVRNGEAAKALTECAPLVDSVKEKDRPEKIPVPLMVALGSAYLQENRLTQAEAVSQELLKWEGANLYPPTGEFRNALRLAEAQARVKAEPDSAAAHAGLGRVLMDQSRWEEAVEEMQTAMRADSSLPAVQRDLGYALLHLQGRQETTASDLEEALASAEKQVQITDSKGRTGKSKDFFSWHTLGILLYNKAYRQQEASDPAAAATFGRCREALREALRCGRSGAAASDGIYLPYVGYASPSVVAISGFAYPEANSDFVLLESLKALDRDKEDHLAQFNLGTALLDLGYPDLAEPPIRQAQRLHPEWVEPKYALALIALSREDRNTATALLQEVVQANPNHPRANLTLAKLYADSGDMAAAAACLAAHTKVYGTVEQESAGPAR